MNVQTALKCIKTEENFQTFLNFAKHSKMSQMHLRVAEHCKAFKIILKGNEKFIGENFESSEKFQNVLVILRRIIRIVSFRVFFECFGMFGKFGRTLVSFGEFKTVRDGFRVLGRVEEESDSKNFGAL